MKQKIVLSIIIMLIFASLVTALNYSDLLSEQKHHYWVCVKDNQCSNSRNPSSCYSNCMQEAAAYNPSQVECIDTDGLNYFTKGIVTSPFYFEGKEDYCVAYGNKVYLFEYTCKDGKYRRYQKNCKEIGENYGCFDGACVITNNIPEMNSISDKIVKENEQLTFTITASDLDSNDLSYDVENLPESAVFDTNTGEFSFSPGYDYLQHKDYEFTKTFNVKFRAFDGEFHSDWLIVKVTVKDVNRNPVLSNIGNKEVNAGETLSFTLSASDPDDENYQGFHLYWCTDSDFNDCYFSKQYNDLPNGISLNSFSGKFTWNTQENQAGTYYAKFYAWDIFGGKDSENVIINIIGNNYESTLTEHNMVIESKNREYWVYEPSACKTKECPLLFVFHRMLETAQQPINNYNWQETADNNDFIVVYPESLTITESKPFDIPGKHWDLTPLEFSETQDTKFVEEMIDQVDQDYGVDNFKVFTTGHSYGGYFSYYVNFVLPNKIKAFGTHSAGLQLYEMWGQTIYWPAEPLSANDVGNVPAIIIYDKDDSIAPKEYADTLESQMIAKGHSPIEKLQISGFNHEWDPSKNQMQWDFFMDNS